MRINVVLDDDLVNTALGLSGLKTKKSAIEEGLKLLIQLNQQSQIRDFRGRMLWTSDLNRTRADR